MLEVGGSDHGRLDSRGLWTDSPNPAVRVWSCSTRTRLNLKKLRSLKHGVRSQITRLKLQKKSFLWLSAGSIVMNIVHIGFP